MSSTATINSTVAPASAAVDPVKSKNKYSYFCFNGTQALIRLIEKQPTDCLTALAKILALIVPVFALLELIAMILLAPITFIANQCSKAPTEDVPPPANPEVKLEVKPEIKPEVKLEIKPEVKPEIKPEVKPPQEEVVKPAPLQDAEGTKEPIKNKPADFLTEIKNFKFIPRAKLAVGKQRQKSHPQPFVNTLNKTATDVKPVATVFPQASKLAATLFDNPVFKARIAAIQAADQKDEADFQ